MIAVWMLYAALVAALAGAAASAAERALRLAGRPARWAWLAAMAVSFAVPAASLLVPERVSREMETVTAAGPSAAAPSVSLLERAAAMLGWMDRPLLLAWTAATLATLAFLALSGWSLRRFRRALPAAEVEGVPVRLSRDAGPAVLGLVRGEIVLPAWALAKEERLRRLMLEHEREHLRAGDPRLLLAALVAVAAAPWSPALWWQFRRLKEALEMDCDARVLRRGVDVRAYAELLIEVGRRARPSPLAVAAFSSPATRIEKRISAMTHRPSTHARAGAALSAAVAAGLLLLACETPHPQAPDAPTPSRAPDGTATYPRTADPSGAVQPAGPSLPRQPAPEGTIVEPPAGAVLLPKTAEPGEPVTIVTEIGEPVKVAPTVAGPAAIEVREIQPARAETVMVPGQARGTYTVRPARAGAAAAPAGTARGRFRYEPPRAATTVTTTVDTIPGAPEVVSVGRGARTESVRGEVVTVAPTRRAAVPEVVSVGRAARPAKAERVTVEPGAATAAGTARTRVAPAVAGQATATGSFRRTAPAAVAGSARVTTETEVVAVPAKLAPATAVGEGVSTTVETEEVAIPDAAAGGAAQSRPRTPNPEAPAAGRTYPRRPAPRQP